MVNVVDALIRGFEKPIILLLLSYKPRHGYELIKEFKTITGRKLKPSIVYPFLHWLEKEGLAVSKRVERGKRRLNCYFLTEKGEQLLKNLRGRFSNSIKEVVRDLIKKEES